MRLPSVPAARVVVLALVATSLFPFSTASATPANEGDLFYDPPIGYQGEIVETKGPIEDIVFDIDREVAYMAISGADNGVARVRTSDFAPLDWVDLDGIPTLLEALEDGTLIVGTQYPAALVVIDPDTFVVTDRIDVSDVLGQGVGDLVEIASGEMVVVGRGRPTATPVVKVDLNDGSIEPIGDGLEIGFGQGIYGEFGDSSVFVGGRFVFHEIDVASGSLLRSVTSSDFQQGEEGVLLAGGSRLLLPSGSVVDLSTLSIAPKIPRGVMVLSEDGSRVFRVAGSSLYTYDADTLELVDEFRRACLFAGLNPDRVVVHPAGDRLVVIGTSSVGNIACVEPLDGSGVQPVKLYISVSSTAWSSVDESSLAVFDSTGRLIQEISDVDYSYSVWVRPGEYSLIVYGAVDGRRWPLFSEWVGGATALAREGPDILSLTETYNAFSVELDAVYFDLPAVSRTFWDSILWLQATGITRGCGQDLFCPNDFVTRGQMAAFLDRALDLPRGGPSGFVDDGGTFQQNIWNLREAGITTGCASDRFCPDDFVTRGQMAAFLERALADEWTVGEL
jgi:S-layer homology domain